MKNGQRVSPHKSEDEGRRLLTHLPGAETAGEPWGWKRL